MESRSTRSCRPLERMRARVLKNACRGFRASGDHGESGSVATLKASTFCFPRFCAICERVKVTAWLERFSEPLVTEQTGKSSVKAIGCERWCAG